MKKDKVQNNKSRVRQKNYKTLKQRRNAVMTDREQEEPVHY